MAISPTYAKLYLSDQGVVDEVEAVIDELLRMCFHGSGGKHSIPLRSIDCLRSMTDVRLMQIAKPLCVLYEHEGWSITFDSETMIITFTG